jgi:hypothetical protein
MRFNDGAGKRTDVEQKRGLEAYLYEAHVLSGICTRDEVAKL